MIKQNLISLLLMSLFFSCQTQNKDMDIRNTSINDYEATYIFNIENSLSSLKKINEYALNAIKEQQRFIDSLKNTASKENKPVSFQDRLNSTSLSTIPEDVIFYTPPENLADRVREKDEVIQYKLNTETFAVKNITVGNRYNNNNTTIEAVLDKNNCTLVIDQKDFTLDALHSILKKSKQLQYQNKYSTFNYKIKNKEDKTFLDITYKDYGNSLLLNYN